MYRVVITHLKNKIILAYLNDDLAIELQLFTDQVYPVGTIFMGHVARIQKNIEATFVDIAPGKTGFLPGTNHKNGSLIPVQLVKEGTSQKAPKLTDSLSVSGRYAVVYQKKGPVRASSKMNADTKSALIDAVKDQLKDIGNAVILRTNAGMADPADIVCEIRFLQETLQHIMKTKDHRPKSVLYSPGTEWERALKGLYTDKLDEIVTDDLTIYAAVESIFPEKIREKEKITIRLYADPLLKLSKLYSLEKHLSDATNKRVWLKCGGFLMIEQTEALVSIDVNTGKTAKIRDKEDTFLAVNLEAAEEIARQLRLRNLSGIIMIDFINMHDAGNDSALLAALRGALKADPVKTEVHGFTSLGLVEMTRMKGRKTLYEQAGTVSDDETLSGDEGTI